MIHTPYKNITILIACIFCTQTQLLSMINSTDYNKIQAGNYAMGVVNGSDLSTTNKTKAINTIKQKLEDELKLTDKIKITEFALNTLINQIIIPLKTAPSLTPPPPPKPLPGTPPPPPVAPPPPQPQPTTPQQPVTIQNKRVH